MRLVSICLVAMLTLPACSPESVDGSRRDDVTSPIKRDDYNSRFWNYDGRLVLLLGGTREDNLFQIPDLEEHLDLLASVGGNYVRNTMSSRDSGNVWPFFQRENGLYDLEVLSDEYFDRFRRLLDLAVDRDVIVQIELWDRFDFAREPWLSNPYRPANNVNYSVEESGLENTYERHPGQNDNPFFRSIPEHDDNELLLRYQHAQVDRFLSIALDYPNVLYTMDNETSATPQWGAYWARFIQEKAAERGREVLTTEMWDDWNLQGDQHRHTLDNPQVYGFADISQNNHNSGQLHWDNLQWARQYIRWVQRPLNNVKIYGADTGRYGTERDAIERFWRNIVGGAASARFHRPPSGLGLSDAVQNHLKSARLVLETYDIFESMPDIESQMLIDREPNEAYFAFIPPTDVLVYFPDRGSVTLGTEGNWTVKWLDAGAAVWADSVEIESGMPVVLSTPGDGHWVAVMSRIVGG